MRFLSIVVCVILLGCSSTKNIASEEKIKQLEKVLEDRRIEFIATEALPNTFTGSSGLDKLLPIGSNQSYINLVNISNYVKISADSISVDLRYYGELQISTNYGSDDGLEFNGNILRYSNKYKKSNNSYTVKFSVNSKNEGFRFIITLFANNTYIMNVNSSNRTSIVYKGTWNKLKE